MKQQKRLATLRPASDAVGGAETHNQEKP